MNATLDPITLLTRELKLPARAVAATVRLLDDGSTVPFIARYRKEVTGGLDEVQIRSIEERRAYLLELDERRQTIRKAIDKQGKLTEELSKELAACETKAALEDIYLPFKKKRRTRAAIAREKGLEPIALRILEQPADGHPKAEAEAYIDYEKDLPTRELVLAGARDIVAEVVAETAWVRGMARRYFFEHGAVVSERAKGKNKAKGPTKFEQYYDFSERVATIPSHRYLAVRRGEEEGVLKATVAVDADRLCTAIEEKMNLRPASAYGRQLSLAIAESFKRLIAPSVENDVRAHLKERADLAAVEVFAENLRNLLLAAPLGRQTTVGVDPGLRTGCKCAALDDTGKFLETVTLQLSKTSKEKEKAGKRLLELIAKHSPAAIAVGNGTGGREAESWVRRLLAVNEIEGIVVVSVNESGASIYSASDVAREEFPDLDLTIRGAISIGRRLQDPLAELVKIDPKSIGVGQYQHDVHQPLLQRNLEAVVESCVNHVGVALNTASAPLLSHVAGINAAVAKKIVAHREANGAFETREELMNVSGLGDRAFEQAAGFLRISNGSNPLDASAVHPERYGLVQRIATDLKTDVSSLVGSATLSDQIDIDTYVGEDVGVLTLRDIVAELKKPGRDPRSAFEPPEFRDDVRTLDDLMPGMKLEGVVTNVAAFGAFVDLGVHQDGLVHVSQLADRFVKDPSEVVKVGDKLKVRVLEVDDERKRISLSARMEAPPSKSRETRGKTDSGRPRRQDDGKARGKRPDPKRGKRPEQQRGKGKGPPRGKGERPAKPSGFSNNPFAALANRKP